MFLLRLLHCPSDPPVEVTARLLLDRRLNGEKTNLEKEVLNQLSTGHLHYKAVTRDEAEGWE